MLIKELINPETLDKLEKLKRECEEQEMSDVRSNKVVVKEGVGEARVDLCKLPPRAEGAT